MTEKSAQELNDEARAQMKRTLEAVDESNWDVAFAGMRVGQVTKLAGVGARDRNKYTFDKMSKETLHGVIDDLWACISALAKRIERLEGK